MPDSWTWQCDTDDETLGLAHVLRAKGLTPFVERLPGEGATIRVFGLDVARADALSRAMTETYAHRRDRQRASDWSLRARRIRQVAATAMLLWFTLLWAL